jgi:ABC-type transporter Mla subunit MlaD
MNFDVNNVVKRLRKLETTLKTKIESGSLYNEVKRYADVQAKSLKAKVKSSKDAKKVLAFIEQRKKQIEKLAADLPGDVKTVRTYVKQQRKELEKLGNELLKKAREGQINATTLRTAFRAAKTGTTATTASTAKHTTKKAATKKKAKKRK